MIRIDEDQCRLFFSLYVVVVKQADRQWTHTTGNCWGLGDWMNRLHVAKQLIRVMVRNTLHGSE
jgi:hypothetical protein